MNQRTGLLFIKQTPKTPLMENSFLNKTINWWNSLNRNIKNPGQSTGRFKKRISAFYLNSFLSFPYLYKLGKSWKDFRIN